MATYLEEITERFNAQTHHSFLLHGATRDLQLGAAGSCSLVDHVMGIFGSLTEEPRLVATYRVGVGWRFNLDSERQEFLELCGLAEAGAGSGDFAGLGIGSGGDDLPLATAPAIGVIDAAMRQTTRGVVVVIDRAEFVCPNAPYDRLQDQERAVLSMLQAMAADRQVEATRNILILITDSIADIAESLRLASSRYHAIEIATPDAEERATIARQVFPQLADLGVDLRLEPEEFSSATSMLTRYGLMDILLDARASGLLSKQQVKRVKSQVMSQEYGDILEMLDPVVGGFSAVAGLEPLKALWREIIDNMIAGNIGDVPAGLLMAGAAGLGKSYFMRGVAEECGLPVINFNVGRLLGAYVGQSERNLERALAAIRGAAPCVVVLDEIETTFPDRATAGPSGDSGVGSRILKRMLEELSNPANRGRIVWVGITNFPQKLDAALSRAGRFDLTIAFLPPTEPERLELIRLYAAKYGATPPDQAEAEEVARALAGYTNAEIENIARKARQLQSKGAGSGAWLEATSRVRANTRDVESMTAAALVAVNDSDLLPPEYVDRWRVLTNQTPRQPQAEAAQAGSNARRLF